MSVLYLVLPLALAIAVVAVIAFARAARAGQFDDLDTPAIRMLHDEDESPRARGSRTGRTGDDAPPGTG